jgi:hypothetical protein
MRKVVSCHSHSSHPLDPSQGWQISSLIKQFSKRCELALPKARTSSSLRKLLDTFSSCLPRLVKRFRDSLDSHSLPANYEHGRSAWVFVVGIITIFDFLTFRQFAGSLRRSVKMTKMARNSFTEQMKNPPAGNGRAGNRRASSYARTTLPA